MKIFVTRFNNDTYKEYLDWREKNEYTSCIYNSPIRITERLDPDEKIFVLEMNNSINKIMGIGYLKNHIIMDKKYRIYSDNNYNRYTYKGPRRILRKELSSEDEKILEIFDILLFKGGRHMKRGQGIQAISSWIENNSRFDFVEFLKSLFKPIINN